MILRANEQDRTGQNQMRNEISGMRLVLIFLLKHHNNSFLVKLKKCHARFTNGTMMLSRMTLSILYTKFQLRSRHGEIAI